MYVIHHLNHLLIEAVFRNFRMSRVEFILNCVGTHHFEVTFPELSFTVGHTFSARSDAVCF